MCAIKKRGATMSQAPEPPYFAKRVLYIIQKSSETSQIGCSFFLIRRCLAYLTTSKNTNSFKNHSRRLIQITHDSLRSSKTAEEETFSRLCRQVERHPFTQGMELRKRVELVVVCVYYVVLECLSWQLSVI